MAGVVAMAAIIEDFDTQPCKKARKDGGSPVVKTITNYFSPVSKPVEKPFSPPRSNNIMDYFNRKAPSSKEKLSSPEQSKENCQTDKQISPVAAVKQLSQKRRRKSSKIARKLVEVDSVISAKDDSCFIVEPQDGRETTAEANSSSTVLGSDTAILLGQLCAESCIATAISEENTALTEHADQQDEDEKCSEGGNHVKPKHDFSSTNLSPVLPSKDKVKRMKPIARNAKKKQQQETKQSEPEKKEAENSLCDVSMEVNVDETSQLNKSTVTISFEDFLRSQSQDICEEVLEDEQSKGDESKIIREVEENQLCVPEAEENFSSGEPSVQISPRTVTIHAEVHVVSPKEEPVKAMGKVASIFTRRKGASSPQMETAQQLSPPSLNAKRRSNVVLQEGDLELAVLESESTPKCSEVEKKQFMAAFKQPSLDGSKVKPVKSQGKQKQTVEKTVDSTEKVDENDATVPPSSDKITTSSQENKVVKKKPARKGQKLAKEEKEESTTLPAAAPEETTVVIIEDDDQKELPVTSTPYPPAVRRSIREAVVRQTSKPEPKTPTRSTRRQDRAKAVASLTQDSTLEISTPKRHKSRHGVFKAEVLSPPDKKEIPIRIKFTRVDKNIVGSEAEGEVSKATKDSTKSKQAKKLVEKPKAIQQSKKTPVTEERSLRRSSRTEVSLKKSYCEDEDSVICLEEEEEVEDQTETPKASNRSKTRKVLRSLNDVLGKTSVCKDVKAPPGSKTCQEKAARKGSVVISIFDESSHEGSENSQDDEQFRARREFLKSGLPESFRKQIAKTAATKEAYTLSCSSFQPAIHMNQPPKGCPFWSLPWPESSLLSHLKELWCQISNPPSVTESFSLKMVPTRQASCQRGSGWRPEISESVRQLLMEEVNAFNPSFPAQKFIISFLKRRSDQHCTASELQAVANISSIPVPAEAVRGKRKRKDDDGEMTVKVAKKQRATRSGEKVCQPEVVAEPIKREGRTRRGQKPVLKEEEVKKGAESSIKMSPVPSEDDSVIMVEDAEKQDVVKEDMLWTDKYQPQHSSEILGNTASVKRLHSWLKEWKLRADREDRKKRKEKKQEEGSIDSDWDCGEDDSQDGEDFLCNTILITGPTGVGKTAAVYACAQELGFKVFEVNASSQRSGRLILSQLKEATQSHQVDSQGINAHKPTYFNSYSMSSSGGSVRPGFSPRKVNSPRRVVSSPRKHPQSPRGVKRGTLAPTSLANFFKIGQSGNKEAPNTKKNEQKADSKKITKSNEAVTMHKDPAVKSTTAATAKEKSNEEQNKKTATSLILFEEVDVIFEEDSGFLAAIKTFMSTTKRPVILTTSDPTFNTMFDGNFEEINFKPPSVLNVSTYLQLLCLAEDTRTDLKDIKSLLSLNGCDIRKSLLQLQFWTRSAGSGRITRTLVHSSENDLKTDTVASTLPPCDSGCTESMLGLLNIEPAIDIWELLKSQSLEEAVCWRLMTASKQRGADLIYSNMEKLLPLPLTQLTISVHKPKQFVPDTQDQPSVNPQEPQSDKPQDRVLNADSSDCSDDPSPVKVSSRMRKTKKKRHQFDQDTLQLDSDSEDGFLSLCQQKGSLHVPEKVKESLVSEKVKGKPLTPQEQAKSVPVSQCLQSIADFLDDMSYMDSSLLHSEGDDIHRGMIPTGAMVKDGLTDESRIGSVRENWMMAECVLEIQAAVEALSFNKCRRAVTDAWEKVQQLDEELRKDTTAEMSLPVAPHCEGYSFIQDGPCRPQDVQQRMEVMEDLMLKGVFGTGANRPTAALDYLPALRTICRSEQLKEQGKVKRRFLHYLDAIHLGLQKTSLQHLAEDFP